MCENTIRVLKSKTAKRIKNLIQNSIIGCSVLHNQLITKK